MAATALLIVALTMAGSRFGPTVAGVLAALPTLASVLAVFTHARHGADALLGLLRGMLGGMVAFAAFCVVVALLVDRAGIAAAFLAATLAAVAVQAGAYAPVRTAGWRMPDAHLLRELFERATAFTIGLEEEAMLLDPETLDLVPRAVEVMERLDGDPRYKLELSASQMEIVLPPGATVADSTAALTAARRDLVAAADGIAVLAAPARTRSPRRSAGSTTPSASRRSRASSASSPRCSR